LVPIFSNRVRLVADNWHYHRGLIEIVPQRQMAVAGFLDTTLYLWKLTLEFPVKV
jgi:hypothetical protein